MRFLETPIPGAYVVEPEPICDERGLFARTFCREEFAARGLSGDYPQCNVSYNRRAGTLRGMHHQLSPKAEVKLVRCTRGRVFDVIVDLRADLQSHKQWFSVILDAESRRALYIPAGVAHGFLTIDDDSELFYQMGAEFSAEHARGVRWDDPAFGIKWPGFPEVISERDRTYPDYEP